MTGFPRKRGRDEQGQDNPVRVSFILATNPVDVQWSAPLAFGYLKAAAPDHDYSVARSLADIKEQSPDVLGISCMSQDFDEAVAISDYAKSMGVPYIVFGGHHITAFPETLPKSADLAITGEGEWKWAGFLGHGDPDILPTHYRGRPPTIDDLPMPDRTFGMAEGQTPYLFTSRGCPYKCSFCCSTAYWDKARFHSAARVVREVESMEVGHIGIWDDLFMAKKSRIKEIANRVKGTGRTFSAAAKSDLLDDSMCQTMKAMGLTRVGIGAESGSERILKKLKTSDCSVAANQAALDNMKRYDIKASAGIVFGHWEETEADIHKTYRWIMKNYAEGKLMGHEANILTPMPGTSVWEWAEENDYPVREWKRLRFLSMNAHRLGGNIDSWVGIRKANKSLYLNEKNVPQDTLFDIIKHYEGRIKMGRFGVPGVRGAGTRAVIGTAKKAIKHLVKSEWS